MDKIYSVRGIHGHHSLIFYDHAHNFWIWCDHSIYHYWTLCGHYPFCFRSPCYACGPWCVHVPWSGMNDHVGFHDDHDPYSFWNMLRAAAMDHKIFILIVIIIITLILSSSLIFGDIYFRGTTLGTLGTITIIIRIRALRTFWSINTIIIVIVIIIIALQTFWNP